MIDILEEVVGRRVDGGGPAVVEMTAVVHLLCYVLFHLEAESIITQLI